MPCFNWSRLASVGLIGLVLSAPAVRAQRATDYTQYVDPFIGTAPAPSASYGLEFDGGDVFPGAAYPTGMLYWSPDTVGHRIPGGYFYPDSTLSGFSLTHFSGRGCTVYQDVPISPVLRPPTASPRSTPAQSDVSFSHANESAQPGYYSVGLDSGIQVELTVTPRTGLGRLTFPPQANGTVLVNAGGSVNDVFDSDVAIDPQRQLITGHVESQVGCGVDHYTLYYAIAFDRPFTDFGTWSEDQLRSGTTLAAAAHSGAYITFDTATERQVRLKPAISYVSVANAVANLDAENSGWDLDIVRQAARSAWNDVLGRVEVSGGSERNLRVFYTALYHAFFHPNVFNDVNGEYIGFDDRVHQVAAGHAHFHNIPGWDQYRTLVQLRSILSPAETSDIIQSMVDDALQGGGGMPRWEQANRNSAGMVGDSPGPYVASAYAFGAREFDTQAALQALDYGASAVGASSGGHPVREFGEPWLQLGYVPEKPSITLEYAIDDFAIGQFSRTLGDVEKYDRYMRRAANWVNTFDPASGHVSSRDVSGGFPAADHSRYCCGFVEGNGAQYTWMVMPIDPIGLIGRLGGREAALARLDDFFRELNAGLNRPYAWIGNEPSLSAPWAYAFLDAPSRTQAVTRRIELELFDDTPGGLPGNDDGGTTSAWYVFAALGMFPAQPGVPTLALGSPLFEDTRIHLADGGVVHVVGRGASPRAPYVQRLLVDGVAHDSPFIEWGRLAGGATLDFTLAESTD